MSWYQGRDIEKLKVTELEKLYRSQKRKQEGVEFPSAAKQDQILIIRFNISQSILEQGNSDTIRNGLKGLCTFFEEIENGNVKFVKLLPNGRIDLVGLSEFNFSATLGFGKGFFEKLNINAKNCPRKLKEMPDNLELGDITPYDMQQTDFIIQLCSNSEDVNSRVFQNNTDKPISRTEFKQKSSNMAYSSQKKNSAKIKSESPNEIYSAIRDWAEIIDMHIGFQRIDGTNLLGFNDGISNPRRLLNDVVWTTSKEENQKFTNGTYMVFQKIEHDLNKWRHLNQDEQEQVIGRSKGTGLLLGTISKEQDRKLAADLKSENKFVRDRAQRIWKKLYDDQKDPYRKFFDPSQKQYKNIQIECPVWSHVRKSNPRGTKGAERSLIYRRGYLYMDRSGPGLFKSGLLFICFQKDIEKGFEYIKKVFFSNLDSKSNISEKYSSIDSERDSLDLQKPIFKRGIHTDNSYRPYATPDIQLENNESNTGKTNLTLHEPHLGDNYSSGQIPGTITMGGGYYFIPPIPNKKISNLSEQFFT